MENDAFPAKSPNLTQTQNSKLPHRIIPPRLQIKLPYKTDFLWKKTTNQIKHPFHKSHQLP